MEKKISSSKKYLQIINSSSKSGKALRLEDSSGRYSEYLKSTLKKNNIFKKFKVVLDCANGATYQVAPNLFWELGHEVISINNNPDGTNINKNCGAVDVSELKKTVLQKRADIGFAFDGDGDRLIVVDEKGNEVDGDKIIALFAKYFIGLKNKPKNLEFIINAQCNAVKNIFKLKKIPYRQITFNQKNDEELGEIFTFFVLETILLSRLMKINPFDQPAVEQVKIEVKKILR